MIELEINGKTVKAKYTVWALALYEQEFDGANLIADLFGKVEMPPLGEEAGGQEDRGFVLDFTQNNWTTYLKVLWAGIKAANDKTKGFEEWAKSVEDINLWTVVGKVSQEVMSRCFRVGASTSE